MTQATIDTSNPRTVELTTDDGSFFLAYSNPQQGWVAMSDDPLKADSKQCDGKEKAIHQLLEMAGVL